MPLRSFLATELARSPRFLHVHLIFTLTSPHFTAPEVVPSHPLQIRLNCHHLESRPTRWLPSTSPILSKRKTALSQVTAKGLTASRYYDSETLSDVTVKFGDNKIKAHKIILCQGSEFFRASFTGRFKVSAPLPVPRRPFIDSDARKPRPRSSSSTTTALKPSTASSNISTATHGPSQTSHT